MINQNSKNIFLTLLIGVFLQLAAMPVAFSQTKVDQIDRLMSLYTEYGQFNGTVLVAEKGEVIFKKGYGMANMEWDIPNQPNTKHRLGSITKQFTAMLILQLAEQGKLDLQANVNTYLPDYPEKTGGEITVHHLLTHSSGIPNYTSFQGFFQDKSRNPYSPEEFVGEFADLDLDFKPGEKFSYSNSGYFLLGVIIEKVSGKTYEELLQENIFTPLKMTGTGYDHHGTILKNRATGYEKNGNEYKNSAYLDMSIPYAAGSLYSTVEDLYLWDQALYTEKLLSKKYMDMMFAPHIPAFGGHYGYGWSVNNVPLEGLDEPLLMVSHGGGINGFNTNISRVLTDKHLIVLFNNTGGADLNEMTFSIGKILYDRPHDWPKKSLAYSYYAIVLEQGLPSGLKHFSGFKNSDKYDLSENEMNTVGYQLLQSEMVKEAIETFKLNVEAFPESGNVYDSLGEAYLENGNKEMAIKFYRKSVEIDPSNTNGAEILKKLENE
jgi:CubicO group peptidase (beta-lactamase class C family)